MISALIQVRAKHCFYSGIVLILKHACKILHHKHCFYSSLANVNMLALSCILVLVLNFSFFFVYVYIFRGVYLFQILCVSFSSIAW